MPVADGFTNLTVDTAHGFSTISDTKIPGARNKKQHGKPSPKLNAFTNLVERTVESWRGDASERASDTMRTLLVDIRKQYDEVHYEAKKGERELADVRGEVSVLEAQYDAEVQDMQMRIKLAGEIREVDVQIEQASECKKVYEHMHDRLQREQKVVEQKIGLMEQHLKRKELEVAKKQDNSRRIQLRKVSGLHDLEELEETVQLERAMCGTALDELQRSVSDRKEEIQHKDSFEYWRYEVGLEAATDAFHKTLARYQKTYAIEKMTGNCLQKMLYEQQEQSQRTEDGFQQIREVTGLQASMDIVQKFLHREDEHERLKKEVRETEVKLQSLRDSLQSVQEETLMLHNAGERTSQPPGLLAEVQRKETELLKLRQAHDNLKSNLHNEAILCEKTAIWADRVRNLFGKDADLIDIKEAEDLPSYFDHLEAAVQRLINKAKLDQNLAGKLNEANVCRDKDEWKAIQDKEVVRFNCRVPANLDPTGMLANPQMQQQLKSEEERMDAELQNERERLKDMSSRKVMRPRDSIDTNDKNKAATAMPAKTSAGNKAAGSGAAAVRQRLDNHEVMEGEATSSFAKKRAAKLSISGHMYKYMAGRQSQQQK
jgi:hypothetical protein